MRTIGTCGSCGGAVQVPDAWWSVGPPPPPTCASCGAVARESYGPVIPMKPRTGFPIGWSNPVIDSGFVAPPAVPSSAGIYPT